MTDENTPNEEPQIPVQEEEPQAPVKQMEVTQKMENVNIPNSPPPSGIMISESEVKNWCMFCHASAFIQFFGFPSFIGPLVIWLIKKNEISQVDQHGKEALNFQLSILLYSLICIPLCFVLIGFLLLPVIGLLWLIFTIVATVQASDGKLFRYPLTIRFLK
jgi:uncharacterized Tic20 family protein